MPALQLKLPTTFAAPAFAKWRDDPILPDAGALMLLDATHPVNPWAAGVPATLSVLPNLAAAQAKPLVIAGTDANVGAVLTQSLLTGTSGKVERSTKGGLHTIFSQTLNNASADYLHIKFADALAQYLVTNYQHNIYMSQWTRVTRVQRVGSTAGDFGGLGYTVSSSAAFKERFRSDNGVVTSTAATTVGTRGAPLTSVGPKLNTVGAAGGHANVPTSIANLYGYLHLIGNAGTVNTAGTTRGAAASQVFYRAYVEDLTVSGRTYAEVDAIDNALYTKEVLTAGGRYYGDTFTDPATIA